MNLTNEILEKSAMILQEYDLCPHCLGRLFGSLGTNMSNDERGNAILTMLRLQIHYEQHESSIPKDKPQKLTEEQSTPSLSSTPLDYSLLLKKITKIKNKEITCYICHNVFDRLEEFASKALNLTRTISYTNFLVGSRFDADSFLHEEEIWLKYNITTAEPLKKEFNREMGKQIEHMSQKLGDPKNPHIHFFIDVPRNRIEYQIEPVYIAGRYLKYVRDIPQTTWFCTACDGVGCEVCNYTGKKYPTSVEELIAPWMVEFHLGHDHKFHGAGREDIDARMLGTGRPFVVEIKNPHNRQTDLSLLQDTINKYANGKVEVKDLRYSSKKVVRALKNNSSINIKAYEAEVKCDQSVTDEELQKIVDTFHEIRIEQHTPIRVLHRRSDRPRYKMVHEIKILNHDQDTFKLHITCQGGTYVKELISGDQGRTKPSITSILGKQCVCTALDVVMINETIQR